jgi:hypothetical protein
MMPADEAVGNIAIHFCLLKFHSCDENPAIVGGYGYHGQTCGVWTRVVGCAFISFLGMEYEQYSIQKCLDITLKKNAISIPSCAPEIP